jgi:hypothetical protein
VRNTTLPIALALLAIAVPAHADDPQSDDDEDAYFVPFTRHSIAAGFTGHGGRIDGKSESGMGARLELGYGRGRWEYLAEGELETSALQQTEMSSSPGRRTRGALGVRWLARQFIPFDQLGIEMYLKAAGGVASYHWMDDHSTRPDIDLGVGFGVRKFARHDIFVRLDLDLLFSRGDSGFAGGLVLGW